MKYEIVNSYTQARSVLEPVCSRPLGSDGLCALLEEGAKSVFLERHRKSDYFACVGTLRLFRRFLELRGLKEVIPDERLLNDFQEALETELREDAKKPYGERAVNRCSGIVRRLLNERLLPHGHILRRLAYRLVYLKYVRFLSLSEVTQKLLIAYETDGRRVVSRRTYFTDPSTGREGWRVQIELKGDRLSGYNRMTTVRKVLTALDALGKRGIEEITKDDLESLLRLYRGRDKEATASAYLESLYSVVGNGVALGLLQTNPFDGFPLPRRRRQIRKDFVPPPGVEKLFDLKSLAWKTWDAVRNRCVTLLTYDTGLRVSAVAQLEAGDVKELSDGRYEVRVRGEYLKGRKEDRTLYLLFQETVPVLRSWINMMRPKCEPQSKGLFLSIRGKSLTSTGIRGIVQSCCRGLRIRTEQGNVPSPHILRHSLATNNTAPFGKCLEPYLMQQRLAHIDLQIFMTIYVHNNPLAEKEEYRKLFAKGSSSSFLDKVGREDFLGILDSLTMARDSSIRDIKRAYEEELRKKKDGVLSDLENKKWIEETECHRRISPLKINYRSLRSWAFKEGHCRIEVQRGTRRYLYDKKVTEDLLGDYMTREDAFRKFHGSRSLFYKRISKCKTVRIGRSCLVWKDDFIRAVLGNVRDYKKDTDEVSGVS